jgi:2-methylcitrate dehydratase PrpD
MLTKPTAKNGVGMTTNTLTSLAQAVHTTRYADFSPTTIHKIKIHLSDTLGVSLAGAHVSEAAL